MRRLAALALLFAGGCSVPQAAYVREDLAPGELAMVALHGQLRVIKGQAGGPPQLLDFDHTYKAVGCVPDAVGYMDAAKSIQTTGTVMKWIGWAAAIAGTAVVIYSAMRNDDRYIRPAISIATSGGLLTQTPRWLSGFAFLKVVDAVHAYEDQRPFLPGCGGRAPPPPPAPNPPALPPPPPEPEAGPGGPRF